MKYLTDRREIAEAINFGKYPVLTLNRENRPYAKERPDSDYAIGCRVRVAWDHKDPRYARMTTHGNLYIENGKLKISGEGSFLSASFGYHDVMKMVEEANTPILHKGWRVVVVEEWPSQKKCTVRIMRVARCVDTHCMVATTLEDIDEEEQV